jgi:hypothetical protein
MDGRICTARAVILGVEDRGWGLVGTTGVSVEKENVWIKKTQRSKAIGI